MIFWPALSFSQTGTPKTPTELNTEVATQLVTGSKIRAQQLRQVLLDMIASNINVVSTLAGPNQVWAGPVSGTTGAAPTFRALTEADLPFGPGGGTGRVTYAYAPQVYDLGVNPSNPTQGLLSANIVFGQIDPTIAAYDQLDLIRMNPGTVTGELVSGNLSAGQRFAGITGSYIANNTTDNYGDIWLVTNIGKGSAKGLYGRVELGNTAGTQGDTTGNAIAVGVVSAAVANRNTSVNTVWTQQTQMDLWGTVLQSAYVHFDTRKESNISQYGILFASNVYTTAGFLKAFNGITGISTIGSIVAGSGYTDGTHLEVPILGGTGQNAAADIVVSGGAVTSVTMTSPGTGFTVGDVVTGTTVPVAGQWSANGYLGPGTGFQFEVTAVADAGGDFLALNQVFPAATRFTVDAAGQIIQRDVQNRENFKVDAIGTVKVERGILEMGSTNVPGRTTEYFNNLRHFDIQAVSTSIHVSAAAVAAGGTGYGNAQTFDVTVVGVADTAAIVNVTSNSSGVVTTVNSITNAGAYSGGQPVSPNPVTGGTGSGLTLNLTFVKDSVEGYLRFISPSVGDAIRIMAADANNPIYLWVGGAIQQVTVDANDSCSAGFRCLRIPN